MKRVVSGRYKEFDIVLDDRTNALADVSELLANSGVNIKAISVNGETGLKIITSDEATTRETLRKAKLVFDEADVISLKLADRPGELAKVSRLLSKRRIRMQSVYLLGGEGGTKDVIIKVADTGDALKALC
jgi:hypothetical protein